MMSYKTGAFLAAFAGEASKRAPETVRPALVMLFESFRETIGFPRGASYTIHKDARKGSANVSLAVEPREDGKGFDVILNPMAGGNASDAAWKLFNILAAAVYPAAKAADGKSTDHKRPLRAELQKALGLSRDKGVVSLAGWPELPFPPAVYRGSEKPNPKRIMLAFLEPGPEKMSRYYSLLADGSQQAFIQTKYASGELVSCKTKGAPQQYQPPVAQTAAA